MCGERIVEKEKLDSYLDTFLQNFNSYTPDKFIENELSPQRSVKILTDHFASYE